jgi:hypothetical protein
VRARVRPFPASDALPEGLPVTSFDASNGVHSSGLGKRDARRAEARRRLRNLSPRRRAELASRLGIEDSPRAFAAYAAEHGVEAIPNRPGNY